SRQCHPARCGTVVEPAVLAVAGGDHGAGDQRDGVPRRPRYVGDQTRPRRQRLGPDDRGSRRHARPPRLGHLRRPNLLSPHPLLVGGVIGQAPGGKKTRVPTSRLSRGGASAGEVGSSKPVWAEKRCAPLSAESKQRISTTSSACIFGK